MTGILNVNGNFGVFPRVQFQVGFRAGQNLTERRHGVLHSGLLVGSLVGCSLSDKRCPYSTRNGKSAQRLSYADRLRRAAVFSIR